MNKYIVKHGDSLAKIALSMYGDPSRWKEIYDANRTTIKNPNMLLSGQLIVIPELKFSAAAKGQRSMMTPEEQLRHPEKGISYPIELEVIELLAGVTALLRGLTKLGIKVFSKVPKLKNKGDIYKAVINPKSGKKEFPNSPYVDKTKHPKEIMEEVNKKVEADMKAMFDKKDKSYRNVGRQNAEIERIHKEFIETGKWPLKRKDLGEHHSGLPDATLMKLRREYESASQKH